MNEMTFISNIEKHLIRQLLINSSFRSSINWIDGWRLFLVLILFLYLLDWNKEDLTQKTI